MEPVQGALRCETGALVDLNPRQICDGTVSFSHWDFKSLKGWRFAFSLLGCVNLDRKRVEGFGIVPSRVSKALLK